MTSHGQSMAQIRSPHPKVPFLGMNSKKPLPKRLRRTQPYPKQPSSPGEILVIGEPATQDRVVGKRTSFFEGALLPGTETGGAGVFSRTTRRDQRRTILPRTAPATARATSNRVRPGSPCSTNPSSQHGKPNTRSHHPPRISTQEPAGLLRNQDEHGIGPTAGPSPSGGQAGPLLHKLAAGDSRRVGSTYHNRVQTRILQQPTSGKQARICTLYGPREAATDVSGDRSLGIKGSHCAGQGRRERVCQPHLSGPQGRWFLATSYKPKTTQQVHNVQAFQNGVCQVSQRPSPARGLDAETRLKGRLPGHSNTQAAPAFSAIRLGGAPMAIQNSSLWPQQRAIHLYKDDEASSGGSEEVGNQGHNIPGRHAVVSRKRGRGQEAPGHNIGTPDRPGICHQPQEKCLRANKEASIPGLCPRLHQHDHVPSDAEDPVLKERVTAVPQPEEDLAETARISPRDHGGSPPSCPSSTASLSSPGTSQDPCHQERLLVRGRSETGCQHEKGPGMVDDQHFPLQWQATPSYSVGFDDRVGRVQPGVGRQLPRDLNWRPMDTSGESPSHQLSRAAGGIPSPEILCGHSEVKDHPPAPGQCLSYSLHKQDGRNSLSDLIRPCSPDLGLVHREGPHNSCRTHPGSRELVGRLGVSPCQGLQRLEAEEGNFPTAGRQNRPLLNRSLCLPHQCPTDRLLQLETRSVCSGHRCPLNFMAGPHSLHVPSICIDTPVLGEAEDGEGHSHPDSPSMATTELVPTVARVSDRPPDPTAPITGHPDRCGGSVPPNGVIGTPPVGHLDVIRRSYLARGISDRVIEIIQKSWRPSTQSSYGSAWRLWSRWCLQRGVDPLSAPLGDVLEFLADQFEEGKQYRTINSLRSAISMTHAEVDGRRLGQHPIVTRFLKGVFNTRPPAPKYSATWDVDSVLSYLTSLPDNDSLSFKQLSHKLAMLMALSNADRCSDLTALDLDFRSFTRMGVKFMIPGLTKTRRQRPSIEAFYPEFIEDPRICPVHTLRCYERRSKEYRSHTSPGRPLFIAVRKPHRPVTAATIGRWLKSIMASAGTLCGY